MDKIVSSFSRSRLFTLTQAAQLLRPLSDQQLYNWLVQALDEGSTDENQPQSRWDLDAFIVDVYRECDPSLQLRLRSAFDNLLESFVPSLTPNKNAAYLSALLTLASNFRSKRVKERLRRWLYDDMFNDLYYRGANLHGRLIVATSVYDVDEEWLNHLKNVLPGKPFFPKVARHTYRALLDTVGLESVEELPKVLQVIDHEDPDEKSGLGYLLRLSMKKFGREMFLSKTAEVLNSDWRMEIVFQNTLNLEEFLEAAFTNKTDCDVIFQDLDQRIWKPWVDRWLDLDTERSTETFKAIMVVCKPQPVAPFIIRDALGALDFRLRHYLVVPKTHQHLRPFFDFNANVAFARAAAGSGSY
ncbi:MAG TPA: hypothetical protein VJT15_06105 [Pyrinomonadaceae bacterium]|nr:hypothetical protein [Pyrinomonadaceae bacterium]